MNQSLTSKDIYIFYVIKYFRKNINEQLSELDSIHRKKKFIRKIRNPRHVDFLSNYSRITYTDFKCILEYMNKKSTEEIIGGRTLILPRKLGQLFIKTFKRKPKISNNGQFTTKKNWKASLERKQELIDQGRLPLKYFKDETNKIIGSNEGEPWIIYYSDTNISKFNWGKLQAPDGEGSYFYPLTNASFYYFRCTKDNRILLNKSLTEGELQF